MTTRPIDAALGIQDTPLSIDLPCMRCTYNLRTKRPSEKCPECGLPVAPSITAFQSISLHNHRRAALGAALLAIAALTIALWTCTQLMTVFDLLDVAWSWDHLTTPLLILLVLTAATALAGTLLLITGSAPAHTPRRPWSLPILIVAALLLVPPAALAFPLSATTLWTGVARPEWLDNILPLLAITAHLFALPALIIGGWFLIQLAYRRGWPLFATATAALFLISLLTSLISILCIANWWYFYPGWGFGSGWFDLFLLSRIAIDDASPALLILFILYWTFLALRLRRNTMPRLRRRLTFAENQVFTPAQPLLLAADVPCKNCGYNLRTRRLSDRCPECGQPVAPSVAFHRAQIPAWVGAQRLATAAILLIVWSLGSLLTAAFTTVGCIFHDLAPEQWDPLLALASLLAGTTLPLILTVAILLLAASHSAAPDRYGLRTAGFITIFSGYALATIFIANGCRELFFYATLDSPALLALANVLAPAAAFLLLLYGLWFMHSTSRHPELAPLARQTHWLFPAAAAVQLYALMLALWNAARLGTLLASDPNLPFLILRGALDITLAICFTLYWLRCARLARAIPRPA